MCFVFFFKQKTAYEMRISDWSSDVCSSDLDAGAGARATRARRRKRTPRLRGGRPDAGRSGAGAAGGGLPGMTSASTWFQRYLLPGFVFQAAVIAGRYATGREQVEFFLPAGPGGGPRGRVGGMDREDVGVGKGGG